MKPTILAFPFLASLAFAGDPISFRKLPDGERIHVTFTSTGCFHSETYEFDFRKAATLTADVTQVELRWNETLRRHEVAKRIPLGTVTLSEAEIAGLDRLFAFYRTEHPGGCTTVDEITATRKNGDAVTATESFTDGSCATYEMKEVTLLRSLALKLKEGTD